MSLVKVRTVNLRELAQSFEGKSKFKSKYKRIQRFFDNFDLDLMEVSAFLLKLFSIFNQLGFNSPMFCIGNKWIKYLSERQLNFFICLKKNMIVEAFNAQFKVNRLFSGIKDSSFIKKIANAKLSGIDVTLTGTVNNACTCQQYRNTG